MIQQSSETAQIPDFLRRFFWEYDPRALDVERHADVIMGRIMERGNWDAMRWLRQTYPVERLRRFLEMRGQRMLPPRELNYWALICDIPADIRQHWLKQARNRHTIWNDRYAC